MRAGISGLLVAVLVVSPGLADDLLPIELGPIPRFPSEAASRCPGDIVVWADRDSGYFYPKSRPQYGQTKGGVFTCLRAAKAADYWDIDPFSELGSSKAEREFPIDPSLLGYGS